MPLLKERNDLKEVKLDLKLSSDGLLECLTHVTHLTKFTISYGRMWGDPEAFVNCLIPSSEQPEPLCPELQHLVIKNIDVKEELLLNLAHSRNDAAFQGTVPLRVLQCSFDRFSQFTDIEMRLEELRSKGVQVDFKYPVGYQRDEPSLGQQSHPNSFDRSVF
ncbi:hypothetical protein VKT23_001544 [Stygiomarasmius scandens]|uniref:FBD domain-containing protein n=1 Tax=Marasmiellus scandens TaxID=2682957 RepID=A0ABR1K4R2_9AGAR